MPMSKVIPIGEAAQALGVSLDTLRRWDREGRL
jgi:excisionase family DNA binding protein